MPFYAVGPTTAENLRNVASKHEVPRSLSPSIVRGGSETGSGEKLAHFIINDLTGHSDKSPPTLPLLYLTGDKTADTIPRLLDSVGLSVQPCQVYETRASTTFDSDFTALLDKATRKPSSPCTLPFSGTYIHARPSAADRPASWVAFFSPSGARTSLPAIRQRFRLLPHSAEPAQPAPVPAEQQPIGTEVLHLAAIGPTTANFLRDKCNLAVSAMPEIPEPEALADAIARYDRARGP